MKTEEELNAEILAATLKIQEHAPELLKYIGEMPITIPDGESGLDNNGILADYLDSLNQLLKKYEKEKQTQFKLPI
jgi:hypothetical protein